MSKFSIPDDVSSDDDSNDEQPEKEAEGLLTASETREQPDVQEEIAISPIAEPLLVAAPAATAPFFECERAAIIIESVVYV
jgi:hypothetical protein